MLIVSGCTTSNGGTEGNVIVISDGGTVDTAICQQKGIADKIVVFHSPTCPACRQTLPVLEEIEAEYDYDFMFIDLSTERDAAEELGIMPTHIPTILIKCKAYTGFREKSEFLSLMG
ncbi:MAG: thioredoxin family protein [Candidatus Aenigmarchaeota archaeon]|nr:thioredoxin family protein [Candidatus Aenigmarchaeota archaeon]